MKKQHWIPATAIAVLICATPAKAEKFKIHFRGSAAATLESGNNPRPAGYLVPAPPGNLSVPAGSVPVPGASASPNYGAGVPNQIVTFLHPYTNKAITVPLTLPVGKPTVITKKDRIIYSYGLLSYKIVVKFHPGGGVEVRYGAW